jgi:hypothetical protein
MEERRGVMIDWRKSREASERQERYVRSKHRSYKWVKVMSCFDRHLPEEKGRGELAQRGACSGKDGERRLVGDERDDVHEGLDREDGENWLGVVHGKRTLGDLRCLSEKEARGSKKTHQLDKEGSSLSPRAGPVQSIP